MGDTDGRGSGAGGKRYSSEGLDAQLIEVLLSERMPRATRYDFCRSI